MLWFEQVKSLERGGDGGFHWCARRHYNGTAKRNMVSCVLLTGNDRYFLRLDLSRWCSRPRCFLGAVDDDWYLSACPLHALLDATDALHVPVREMSSGENEAGEVAHDKEANAVHRVVEANAKSYSLLQGERIPIGFSRVVEGLYVLVNVGACSYVG